MTIGIAAAGPQAGLAILRALHAVERVGRGAVGGFVSLVALTQDGGVARLETQRGGAAALLDRPIAPAILSALRAGLMSSGPDRPDPLCRFTPAAAGVGLVTGHRMPNMPGADGIAVNARTLALMAAGVSPEEAVERVVAAEPMVDAGLIALSADGRMHAADTALVLRRADLGFAVAGSPAEGGRVAVLHNAIRPHQPLAALAAGVALDVMAPPDVPDGWITFRRGTSLSAGPANAVDVDAEGIVDAITVEDPRFVRGVWSVGLGYEAAVRRGDRGVGALLYEPYMVVEDGRLVAVDGGAELRVPIRLR